MSNSKWPKAGQKVTLAPTLKVRLPAFPVRYPNIINPELIEPGARAGMEESWKKGHFEEREAEIFRINGAHVYGECLILDKDLQVITNAGDHYSDEEIQQAIGEIIAAREATAVPHFDRPTILAKRRAAHNYGHFLMEMLPMAYVGSKVIAEQDDPRYLIHHVPPPAQDAAFRAFRLLGIDLNRLLLQVRNETMYFDDLIVVRGLTRHGTYMSSVCVATLTAMSNRLVDIFDAMPGRGSDKIFVRRVPGWRRGRELHNEEEVYRRLAARGFQQIEPGSMSLEQQIIMFSRARQVIGVAGAAMTNIAFCRPDAKVTMLFPGTFPDTFFWFIAQHRGLDYLEIRGDQTQYGVHDSWNAGFTIREKDIHYLEEVRIRH